MTNQQITQLENKVKNIQTIINNWKQEINQYEKILPALIEEINQLNKEKYEQNK